MVPKSLTQLKCISVIPSSCSVMVFVTIKQVQMVRAVQLKPPQMVKRIVSLLVIVGMSKVANIGARDKIVYPDWRRTAITGSANRANASKLALVLQTIKSIRISHKSFFWNRNWMDWWMDGWLDRWDQLTLAASCSLCRRTAQHRPASPWCWPRRAQCCQIPTKYKYNKAIKAPQREISMQNGWPRGTIFSENH